jgi:HSP20 family molecular chaperone IbpA
LELKVGEDFERKVAVPKGTQIQSKSYSNGVLNVKLQRIENRTKKKTSETVKTTN